MSVGANGAEWGVIMDVNCEADVRSFLLRQIRVRASFSAVVHRVYASGPLLIKIRKRSRGGLAFTGEAT